MSNTVQVQIPVVNERMWQSIQAHLEEEFTKAAYPDDMRKDVMAKARAVFDRCAPFGGPVKISVPGEAEGIATWLNEFADHFRSIIILLISEIANRETQIYLLNQLRYGHPAGASLKHTP